MKSFQRRLEILKLLEGEKTIIISDLSKLYNVSGMTIRRDLTLLEDQGLIIRTHGGAIRRNLSANEKSFLEKRDLYISEKQSIAREVLSLVSDGNCIILDSGTTTGEVARELVSSNKLKLTLITNALNIANITHSSPFIHLILLGGSFRETSMAFMGPMAEGMLEFLNADLAIIGAEGVDLTMGVTVQDLVDANIKKKMMESSRRVIVIADHTKLDQVYLGSVCLLQDIDMLITSNKAPTEFVETARNMGVIVRVAQE